MVALAGLGGLISTSTSQEARLLLSWFFFSHNMVQLLLTPSLWINHLFRLEHENH